MSQRAHRSARAELAGLVAIIVAAAIVGIGWLTYRFGGTVTVTQTAQVPQPSPDAVLNATPTTPAASTGNGAAGTQRPEVVPVAATAYDKGILADELKHGDQKGDWESEAFNVDIKPPMKVLGKLMSHPDDLTAEKLAEIIAADFECRTLRPAVQTVIDTKAVTVQRAADAPADATAHRGVDGAATALKQMLEPFGPHADVKISFKMFKVSVNGLNGGSTAYLETDGKHGGQSDRLQQTATWHFKWSKAKAEDPWRLSGIASEDFEQITYRGGPTGRMFADVTESVFSKEPLWEKQIRVSTDHWRLTQEAAFGIDASGHTGLAIGDVNGDGLDDLYYLEVGGVPNRLFIQQPDGTVKDTSAEAGVDFLDRTFHALLVDLDNDGDQDLIVGAVTRLIVMSNDGTGKFTQEAIVETLPIPQTLTAVDYDNDGDLDLYSANYGNDYETFGDNLAPMPWQDANNGVANQMFRNDGGWKFTDVTKEIGLDENNSRYSLAAAWDDYDNDGDLDLYVANDFGRNNLYRNEGGRFDDVAAAAGAEDISPGMSVKWVDYNNDGLMDIYVGNMFSGAGNRITYQEKFKPEAAEQDVALFQRFARGNTLLRNMGNGKFEDVSEQANVTFGRWAWTAQAVDIDNDGWQDFVVANGYVTGVIPDDL